MLLQGARYGNSKPLAAPANPSIYAMTTTKLSSANTNLTTNREFATFSALSLRCQGTFQEPITMRQANATVFVLLKHCKLQECAWWPSCHFDQKLERVF